SHGVGLLEPDRRRRARVVNSRGSESRARRSSWVVLRTPQTPHRARYLGPRAPAVAVPCLRRRLLQVLEDLSIRGLRRGLPLGLQPPRRERGLGGGGRGYAREIAVVHDAHALRVDSRRVEGNEGRADRGGTQDPAGP